MNHIHFGADLRDGMHMHGAYRNTIRKILTSHKKKGFLGKAICTSMDVHHLFSFSVINGSPHSHRPRWAPLVRRTCGLCAQLLNGQHVQATQSEQK